MLVDADTGGGGILNMQRTVRSLIRSGAKGVVIEDQVWPKRPGHMYNLEVTGMDEFAAKVAAARDEISNDDFFLVARTDARATSAKRGLDDAIARANLYLSAGADAAFIEAPRSRAEMEAICERVRGMVCVFWVLSTPLKPSVQAPDCQAWLGPTHLHPPTLHRRRSRA